LNLIFCLVVKQSSQFLECWNSLSRPELYFEDPRVLNIRRRKGGMSSRRHWEDTHDRILSIATAAYTGPCLGSRGTLYAPGSLTLCCYYDEVAGRLTDGTPGGCQVGYMAGTRCCMVSFRYARLVLPFSTKMYRSAMLIYLQALDDYRWSEEAHNAENREEGRASRLAGVSNSTTSPASSTATLS
jgi:hypothetical protein